LGVLQDQVLREGRLVEGLIERAMDALQTLDSAGAHRVIEQDAEIDNLRFEIEGLAVQLIATQQPMASDLRIIIAALHMIVDLERMGDHAAGIAKIVLLHQGQPLVKPLIDLPRMAEIASRMLREALAAFAARDVAAARRVIREDDEIDQLYDQVYRELLTYMLSDPRTVDRATWLLWAAHNLERIADRATNICERVIFLVTGKMEKESVSGG
jgi:phosphate transport system protein